MSNAERLKRLQYVGFVSEIRATVIAEVHVRADRIDRRICALRVHSG